MTLESETVKLSSKGQLVIPRNIRAALNWNTGTELSIIATHDGVMIKPASKKTGTRLEQLRGCVHYTGPALSDEELCAPVDYCADWHESENNQ